MSRPDPARRAGEHGFTLVEVLVASSMLLAGIVATLGVFTSSKRLTLSAERHAVAADVAQRELDQLRTIDYAELKPTGTPVNTGDARHVCCPYGLLLVRSNPDYAEAVLLPDGTPESKVDPGPEAFAVGSGSAAVTGNIYRYVTWREDDCAASLCLGQDTKRITVAVTIDSNSSQGAGPSRPVWLSSVVGDPDAQPAASEAGGPPGGDASLTTNRFYLHDSSCWSSTPGIPAADHPTHRTALADPTDYDKNSTCWLRDPAGSPAPDLMSEDYPEPYNSPRADIPSLYKYSADPGDAGAYGGLRMRKDGGHSGLCDSAPVDYPYGDEDNPAGPNRWTVHRWSSARFSAPFRLTGRVWLSMFTQRLGAGSDPGVVCVKLIERNEPLFSSGDLPSDVRTLATATISDWDRPDRVEFLTRQLDLPDTNGDGNPDPVDIAAGNNLVLVVSMHQSSADDLKLLYAHTLYPSHLLVETDAQ